MSVHDLLKEYIETGRIKIDKSKHPELTTYHDPCNYARKSERYCCGAGGGAWAAPYAEERIYYGRVKAKQIKDTGAEMLIAPCHNCRDQIMKSLRQEFDMMDLEVKYLWELVADSLIIEGVNDKQE